MVQFLAGLKGEGKTRVIINMANEDAKVTDGVVVFVDDDNRRLHDLHRDIRLVAAGKNTLDNYREFVGFIRGVLLLNSDIQHIYVDSFMNIVTKMDDDSLVKLKAKLDSISEEFHTHFTVAMHCDREKLPEEIKSALI